MARVDVYGVGGGSSGFGGEVRRFVGLEGGAEVDGEGRLRLGVGKGG